MRSCVKPLAVLAALVLLANCTALPPTVEMPSRAATPAPEPASAPVARADLACLAEAIYFEARGTGASGQTAVANVVVNRSASPKFPSSVCGVVADGCQFSYRCDGRPDHLANPDDRARAFRVAEAVLTGAGDITSGALFFHAASAAPGWFATRPRVGEIGGNVFYR